MTPWIRLAAALTVALLAPAAAAEVAGDPPVTAGEIKDGKLPHYVVRVSGDATYGSKIIHGPHLLIENVRMTGSLDIYASEPLVMHRVTMEVDQSRAWAVHTRPGAGRFTFIQSQIVAAKDAPPGARVDVGLLLRADGVHIERANISASADAIHFDAEDQAVSDSVIDGLVSKPGDHNDAIQIAPQARNIRIFNNRITNPHRQTSCIYNSGSDVEITGNTFAGGGWVIYGGASSKAKNIPDAENVRVTTNVFSRAVFKKSGHFGPVAYWSNAKGNVWHNNRFDDGKPVLTGK